MKIIQIVTTAVSDLYGLADDGNLYRWEYKRVKLDEPKGIDEETGQPITHAIRQGWVLKKDELND